MIFSSIILLLVSISFVEPVENKYSKEANTVSNFKDSANPFRMGKLNLLWDKATKRLSEPKLKKLHSEMMIQDQEELTFKKLKSSGGDKYGLKEAELRKKLLDITKKFALEAPGAIIDQKDEQKALKAMFKDKKLNKLWLKAEQSGLTQIELKSLREEFQHHQDKIDEYHMLVANTPEDRKQTLTNDVHQDFDDIEDKEGTVADYKEHINKIRTKHQDLKSSMSKMHKQVSSGPDSMEFSDPKVNGLWKMAQRVDFDRVELDSLYTELKHYEGRIQKLDHLENEMKKLRIERIDEEDLSVDDREKILNLPETEGQRILAARLKKQHKKIGALHDDIEMRIVQRHSEF